MLTLKKSEDKNSKTKNKRIKDEDLEMKHPKIS